MVKVRSKVFETNSSSCHALVTGEDDIFKDFAEGRAVWVPYGLEDIPVELADKCVIRGHQDALMEYVPEKRPAVFLRNSDIKAWAATLDEENPYRKLASAVDDLTLTGLIREIHMEMSSDYDSPDPYTWFSCREVGFTILEDNRFQMEHDWNTWDI